MQNHIERKKAIEDLKKDGKSTMNILIVLQLDFGHFLA
jgi:hypothetical protein